MKKILAALLLAGGFVLGVAHSGDGANALAHPQLGRAVVFFYYRDVESAARFYQDVLGLKKSYDQGWVKMFETGPGSYVGLVDETKGFHKAPAATPAVMLSLETTELEQWNQRLKDKGADFLQGLTPTNEHPLVNNIIIKDPGGYTVEFFRWKK